MYLGHLEELPGSPLRGVHEDLSRRPVLDDDAPVEGAWRHPPRLRFGVRAAGILPRS